MRFSRLVCGGLREKLSTLFKPFLALILNTPYILLSLWLIVCYTALFSP